MSNEIKLGVHNIIVDTYEGTQKNNHVALVALKGDRVITTRNYTKI